MEWLTKNRGEYGKMKLPEDSSNRDGVVPLARKSPQNVE